MRFPLNLFPTNIVKSNVMAGMYGRQPAVEYYAEIYRAIRFL